MMEVVIERRDTISDGLSEYFRQLRVGKFYGKVELDFKEGNIVGIREQRSIQPSFLFIAVSK